MPVEFHPADQRTGTSAAADRTMWWGLAVLTLPVLLVSMDMSVLYLAMPSITDALNPSAGQQLWILDIYGFLIASLLITMGNVGDRIGRRRILFIGAALFGIASVIAAFSTDPAMLIAARALMGIGGASLLPSSLSLLANMFPNLRQRGKAIGVWSAAFAGGAAIGPVAGGVLLHHFWWGVVFLINVPVLAVLFAAGPKLIPEYRARQAEPFDVVGVALSMLAILPTVYAIKSIAADGVTALSALLGTGGVLMVVVFIAHQRSIRYPLLDLKLFSNKQFSAAVGAALVSMMSLGALSYLTGIYLQTVMRQDVLAAAVAGLPMAIAVATFSLGASRVALWLGVRTAFIGAVGFAAMGNLGLLGLSVDSPLWVYLISTSIAGIGYGTMFSLVSSVVVGAAPVERSGSATGISETSFELGNALGLALLGSLATLLFRANSDGFAFGDTVGETLHQAREMGSAGDALAQAAREAYVSGLHAAALTSAVALGILAIVLTVVMRKPPNLGQH